MFNHSPDAIVHGLCNLDGLAAVCERTDYPMRFDQRGTAPDESWCMYLDLKHALQLLSMQQRRAVYYHVIVGLSEDDTAAEMGLQRRTIRDRVRQGLVNIQKILGNSKNTPRHFGRSASL